MHVLAANGVDHSVCNVRVERAPSDEGLLGVVDRLPGELWENLALSLGVPFRKVKECSQRGDRGQRSCTSVECTSVECTSVECVTTYICGVYICGVCDYMYICGVCDYICGVCDYVHLWSV